MSSIKTIPLQRMLDWLELVGVKRGTRNKAIAEKTGYSLAAVKQVLSGNAKLTPRFIQTVSVAFGIDKEWIREGDNINDWSGKVAIKFYEETGERATPDEIESGAVNHQRPNIARLLRIHEFFENTGVSGVGRVAKIAEKTRLTESEIAGILTGFFPLTDDFLKKIYAGFDFSETSIAWIEQGDGYNEIYGKFVRPDPRAGGDVALLDAPTQEIVNDMKKLTESNRWAFVGRAKPIIQAMIDEQSGENTI